MHGHMHRNQGHVTNVFAVDPLSLVSYLTVSPTHPVTGNEPIKTSVARQWQTNAHADMYSVWVYMYRIFTYMSVKCVGCNPNQQ